ncbi:outer membrane protein [Actibacterium pelagium]|uniref:Lipid A oxidase (Involved in formation of 2-aminogluconate) protein n=1 Tax=Actibacterium pelagium TaxID=2029103 RepID=A0A917AHP5_9RHOB|nr:outer membrane beta-barrel protein [Actibacterium pelagium]GGE51902.1 lipid A oxidase (Involved in formation of 2-aminogluconate) protein [Actibacterium pelagium]
MKKYLLPLVAGLLAASPALAEWELSFYTGTQSAPHSGLDGAIGEDDGAIPIDINVGWDGKSFEMPPYYGFRAVNWRNDRIGFGVDFNHAKVYADDDSLAAGGFDRLEFTDGHNILTANVFYRWKQDSRRYTPYVGAGIGAAIPHVDITHGDNRTFGYQLTGPAVQWVAGASYALNDRWSIFGEYKGTYSQNKVELDGGGELETDIITNALNVGVSLNF